MFCCLKSLGLAVGGFSFAFYLSVAAASDLATKDGRTFPNAEIVPVVSVAPASPTLVAQAATPAPAAPTAAPTPVAESTTNTPPTTTVEQGASAAKTLGPSEWEPDLVTLKSGEVVSGVIEDGLVTSDGNTTINLSVIRGTNNYRILPKDQIVVVLRAKGDNEFAYHLNLENESQSAEWYEDAIVKQLKPWLQRYTQSSFRPEMEAKLKAFQEELDKVQKGGHRKGSEWTMPPVDPATLIHTPTPEEEQMPAPLSTLPAPTQILNLSTQMLMAFLSFPQSFRDLIVSLMVSVLIMYFVLIGIQRRFGAFNVTGWSGIAAIATAFAMLLFLAAALYVYGYHGMMDEEARRALYLWMRKSVTYIFPYFPRMFWDVVVLGIGVYLILFFLVAPISAWIFKASWSATVISWTATLICGFLVALSISSWMSSGANMKNFKIPVHDQVDKSEKIIQELQR